MSLIADEREVIVRWSDEDDICIVFTASRPTMTVLDKLVAKFPDTYKLIRAEQDGSAKTYEIADKDLITFRSPRSKKELTEEERKVIADRLAKNRDKGKK